MTAIQHSLLVSELCLIAGCGVCKKTGWFGIRGERLRIQVWECRGVRALLCSRTGGGVGYRVGFALWVSLKQATAFFEVS